MKHFGYGAYQVCSNDEPRLTLTYLTSRSKVCSNGPGHMTKMAATPIYGIKPFKNLLLQNQKADDLGTWYVAFGLWGLPCLFK